MIESGAFREAAHEYLTDGVSFSPQMMHDLRMQHGGSNPAIAMELAGTDDKKSSEYKSTLRYVQKFYKNQKEGNLNKKGQIKDFGPKYQKAAINSPTVMNINAEKAGPIEVSVSGVIQISGDKRERTIKIKLNDSQSTEFLQKTMKDPEDGINFLFHSKGMPMPSALEDITVGIQ